MLVALHVALGAVGVSPRPWDAKQDDIVAQVVALEFPITVVIAACTARHSQGPFRNRNLQSAKHVRSVADYSNRNRGSYGVAELAASWSGSLH